MNGADAAAQLENWMEAALGEARQAAAAGEVPVGAVAVVDDRIVAAARNRVEEKKSVTAHAEIELLRQLEQRSGDWRMENVTVVVTKEPCPMCAGALVNARVQRIVFGLADPRCGGCGSALDVPGLAGQLWHPEVCGGILADRCLAEFQAFFKEVRKRGKTDSGTGKNNGRQ